MSSDLCQAAFSVVNQLHAMISYWTADERCTFSNAAYQKWFGKSPQEMASIPLEKLLGPVMYALNRPYIQAVLRGEKQSFERNLTDAEGNTKRLLATYIPEIVEDGVRGFSAHLVELPMRSRLPQWLPICSSCKDVQVISGAWHPIEDYFSQHSAISFTHSLCPKCLPRYFPSASPSLAPA